MRELALFAGGGGAILGGLLVGFRTVCAVENDPYCIKLLLQRQADGCLPKFPIWDDVRTFDGRHWQGDIDVITGGFPCQDISAAGKGGGLAGERSGLWFEMLRIISEVRPLFVFVENSPRLRTSGLGEVLHGLARLGYDARWGVLGAGDVGANHERKRMWIVASLSDAYRRGKRTKSVYAKVARTPLATRMVKKTTHTLREQQRRHSRSERQGAPVTRITDWWCVPWFARVDDGGSYRMDVEQALADLEVEGVAKKPQDRNARVVITGNMQVPVVAALAWEILNGEVKNA